MGECYRDWHRDVIGSHATHLHDRCCQCPEPVSVLPTLSFVSGGLLYLVIVAMWAAVLIPMWWRQREQVQPVRSVDRFAGAMQTLAGQGSSRRVSRLSPAQRRLRTLLSLMVGLLMTTVMAVAGWIPGVTVLMPLGLIGGFAVLARAQVLREHALRRVQAAAGSAEGLAAVQRAVRRPAPANRPLRQPAPLDVDVPAAEDNAHVRVVSRGWAPTSATLPTYVTAPAATRVPRVIDLTTPGSWTGEAMVREAGAARDRIEDVMHAPVASVEAADTPTSVHEDPLDPPTWARAVNG